MLRPLLKAFRVLAVCLLGGCATRSCDPAEMRGQCASEQHGVQAGLRTDTPTCAMLDELNGERNEDLSNQGAGSGTTGGGTGGGTPGGE